MAKNIVLSIDDVPTKLQLIHAASRLRKCQEILSKSRGKRDTEDPKSLSAAANFLEMLVKREGKGLRKDNNEETDIHLKMLQEKEIVI